ncbi:MAG: HAD-IIA family hydrolase [Candidatus Promineifilaceae bacterium]
MLSQIKNLVLDMDGVLWHGETAMPGLLPFFTTLDRLEISYVLATNNATRTAEQYTQKIARFGLDIPPELILNSAETTAVMLAGQYALDTPAYIVGAKGLHAAMKDQGFTAVTAEEVEEGARPSLVVLGFAPHVCYKELAMAALLVNEGATFVGTNPDPSIPTELGPLPGAGALLAVISTSTGVEPITVGKPGPLIFEYALQRLNAQKENTAMVGDRLTTDIAGAKAAGLWAILVLSGIATREDIAGSAYQPDFVYADIAELGQALERAAGG